MLRAVFSCDLKTRLKFLLYGASLLPAMMLGVCVLAFGGLMLAQLNILLLHALLGRSVLAVGSPWESWMIAACVLVSVGWGSTKMLAWWWADLKASPDLDIRALALSIESLWILLADRGKARSGAQVLEARGEGPEGIAT